MGGFTLLELLVVVFLIGVISSFAVLSVSSKGDDREIEDQLSLLKYQLTMASEESVVQGRPVGVRFDTNGYSFLIAGKSKWLELGNNKIFKSQDLLRNWKYGLLVSDEELALSEAEQDSSESDVTPHIIFYSSGEIDPFKIEIVDENSVPKYRISYGEDGVIALESVDEG
jgi:general secretion pathway protein H